MRLYSALFFLLPLALFSDDWEPLLDENLTQFEVWMGIPHSSVEGLPEGTYQSGNVHTGTPMGLGADVKGVFKMIEIEGEPVLHISGEIYGGLTTLKAYENYHLSVQMKWGDLKWAPRANALRDNGILYHCYGEHGAFWSTWKSSLEYQVQESDMGDFIQLAGAKAEIRCIKLEGAERPRFDPFSEDYRGGYIHAYPEVDAPHGEWNQLDLYVLGNDAIHVVNGTVVMVVENAMQRDRSPLVRGQLQIQSEGAEVFYKDLKLRSIDAFPDAIRSQVRFKEDSAEDVVE